MPNEAYTAQFEAQIREWSAARQSKGRFAHTCRVVEMIEQLGQYWLASEIVRLRLAAWIHDAAKGLSDTELLAYARAQRLAISPFEADHPMLLHGIVAYHQAAAEFGLDDPQIRSACAYHTSGAGDMNDFDKLLYLADLIEPSRDFPQVDLIRETAFQHLDKAMFLAAVLTLRHLSAKRKPIDPRAVALYNALIPKIDPASLPPLSPE